MNKIVMILVKNGIPDYSDGGGINFYSNTIFLPSGELVGEYSGTETLPEYTGPWPLTTTAYEINLKSGQIMQLLGAVAFAKVNAAAYPNDGSAPDPQALFFLESAKYPYSAGGLINVSISPVTDAMQYFTYKEYITQDDATRVITGWPVEVPL